MVIGIILIATVAWLVSSWIRAEHGYPLENEWGGMTEKKDPEAEHKVSLLTSENEKLHGKVIRLEERIAVLERIATDPATRTAREIDELR